MIIKKKKLFSKRKIWNCPYNLPVSIVSWALWLVLVNCVAKITSIKYFQICKVFPLTQATKVISLRENQVGSKNTFVQKIIGNKFLNKYTSAKYESLFISGFLLPLILPSIYWCICEVKYETFIVVGCFNRIIAFILKAFTTLFYIIKGQSQNKLNYQIKKNAIKFLLFLKVIWRNIVLDSSV